MFDSPVPLCPPFSHTTTLSNLMFEMAWADAWARASMCSSMSIWKAAWADPHASMIFLRPSPFLARISYWPLASAWSLA